MEQVLLSLQVMEMQRIINGVHNVSSEFCQFLEGGWHFLSHFFFNFENLSAHDVANILNFPKHLQLLHFG